MKPVPGLSLEQQPDNVLFAIALVAEAANDGDPGMAAVAQVVMNRVRHVGRFPSRVRDVILQPWQFSSFMDPGKTGVPNALWPKLLDLWHLDPQSYAKAEEIVKKAIAGALPDTVGPATHYCTNGLHGTQALWGHDDSAWIAAGHHPHWYSLQMIQSGQTKQTAVVGRQTFGVTA